MKLKFLKLLIFLAIVNYTAQSQTNLLANPSFEEYNSSTITTPNRPYWVLGNAFENLYQGNTPNGTGWYSHTISFNTGGADHFHADNLLFPLVKIGLNHYTITTPPTPVYPVDSDEYNPDEGYAGILIDNGYNALPRNYLAQKFSTNVKNKDLRVKFSYRLGQYSGHYFPFNTDPLKELSIVFSENTLSIENDLGVKNTEIVSSQINVLDQSYSLIEADVTEIKFRPLGGLSSTATWVELDQIVHIPNNDTYFMTLGNFQTKGELFLDGVARDSTNSHNWYYYLDDFNVYDIDDNCGCDIYTEYFNPENEYKKYFKFNTTTPYNDDPIECNYIYDINTLSNPGFYDGVKCSYFGIKIVDFYDEENVIYEHTSQYSLYRQARLFDESVSNEFQISINKDDFDEDGILKVKIILLDKNGDPINEACPIITEFKDCEYHCIFTEIETPVEIDETCCYKVTINRDSEYLSDLKFVNVFENNDLINVFDKTERESNYLYYTDILEDETSVTFSLCNYTDIDREFTAFFFDNDDNINCTQTFTLPGCECICPEDLEDFLIVDIDNGPDNGCSNSFDCRVDIDLRSQSSLACYQTYKYQVILSNDDNEFDEDTELIRNFSSQPMSAFDANSGTFCLPPGKNIRVVIELTQFGEFNPSCTLTKDFFCNINRNYEYSSDNTPCQGDCPENKWEGDPRRGGKPWESLIEIPSEGSGCWIETTYYTRKACTDPTYQDIQIISYRMYNQYSSTFCSLLYPPDRVYRYAVAAAITHNPMKFEPTGPGPNGIIKCDTTWRVNNASCWIEWDIILYSGGDVDILDPFGGSPTFSLEDPDVQITTLVEPCPSSCCVRRFSVCRKKEPPYPHDIVTITDLGLTDVGESCTATQLPNILDLSEDPELIDCQYTCDALEDIEEDWAYFPQLKIAIKDDENIQEKIPLIQFKNYYSNKKLNIRIKKSILDNLKIKISDLNGKIVFEENYQIDKHNEMQFQINLDYLDTGTYVYIIEADNRILNNDKFQIVK